MATNPMEQFEVKTIGPKAIAGLIRLRTFSNNLGNKIKSRYSS